MDDHEALLKFAQGVMDRCQEAMAEAQEAHGEEIADDVCDGYLAISSWCEDIIDGRSLQVIVQSEM